MRLLRYTCSVYALLFWVVEVAGYPCSLHQPAATSTCSLPPYSIATKWLFSIRKLSNPGHFRTNKFIVVLSFGRPQKGSSHSLKIGAMRRKVKKEVSAMRCLPRICTLAVCYRVLFRVSSYFIFMKLPSLLNSIVSRESPPLWGPPLRLYLQCAFLSVRSTPKARRPLRS